LRQSALHLTNLFKGEAAIQKTGKLVGLTIGIELEKEHGVPAFAKREQEKINQRLFLVLPKLKDLSDK
jgi:hypothetical protein